MKSRTYIEKMAKKLGVTIHSLKYERDAELLFGDGGSGWRISTDIGDYFASAEFIVSWMDETIRQRVLPALTEKRKE